MDTNLSNRTASYGRVAYMGSAAISSVLENLLDPLSRCLDEESSRRIVEFRISPALQARLDVLADRANEGTATAEELAEYDSIVTATDFISILKVKAREQFKSNGRRP